MSRKLKLLFVCGRGIKRSATAERIYWNYERFEVRSGGTSEGSRRKVTASDIRWADLVIVMEKKYSERLESMFPAAMGSAVVRCLEIPDEYEFMDEDLIKDIQLGMNGILAIFDEADGE